MKNILVPVGSSKNAKSHLQYAIDFAKAFGAKVYVVQIYNVYTKAGTKIFFIIIDLITKVNIIND